MKKDLIICLIELKTWSKISMINNWREKKDNVKIKIPLLHGRMFVKESKIETSFALFSMMLTMKLEPSPPSFSIVASCGYNFQQILIFAPLWVILIIRASVIYIAREVALLSKWLRMVKLKNIYSYSKANHLVISWTNYSKSKVIWWMKTGFQ